MVGPSGPQHRPGTAISPSRTANAAWPPARRLRGSSTIHPGRRPGDCRRRRSRRWRDSTTSSGASRSPSCAGPGRSRPSPATTASSPSSTGRRSSLTHAGRPPVTLQPLVPHAFSGDDETDCDVAGIAHDFNLIVRRDHARAALAVHRLGRGRAARVRRQCRDRDPSRPRGSSSPRAGSCLQQETRASRERARRSPTVPAGPRTSSSPRCAGPPPSVGPAAAVTCGRSSPGRRRSTRPRWRRPSGGRSRR